jgi:hypothetical protein
MKMNTSVTFTDTTKLGGTTMGIGGMDGDGGNNANTTTSSVGLMSHTESHGECNMEEDDRCTDYEHFETDSRD